MADHRVALDAFPELKSIVFGKNLEIVNPLSYLLYLRSEKVVQWGKSEGKRSSTETN